MPTWAETPKVRVLPAGENPDLFAFFRSPLEKVGCECHLAKSHQEIGKLLSHTKLDIVLSSYAYQSLSEMMGLLAGLRVSMSVSVCLLASSSLGVPKPLCG